MAQIRSGWRSERGAELIEFAVVMPILIFFIAGIFEFGMMFRDLRGGHQRGPRRRPRRCATRVQPAPMCRRASMSISTASGLTGTHTTTVDRPDPREPARDISGESVNRQRTPISSSC